MNAAELARFWSSKSDDAVKKAARESATYNELGQQAIRAELERRFRSVPEKTTAVEGCSPAGLVSDRMAGPVTGMTSPTAPATLLSWGAFWRFIHAVTVVLCALPGIVFTGLGF
jgi:hypothetical protein